jgi:hypothetical protein
MQEREHEQVYEQEQAQVQVPEEVQEMLYEMPKQMPKKMLREMLEGDTGGVPVEDTRVEEALVQIWEVMVLVTVEEVVKEAV